MCECGGGEWGSVCVCVCVCVWVGEWVCAHVHVCVCNGVYALSLAISGAMHA